jgi:hypothetical protein
VLRLGLHNFGLPRLADQLLDRWHWVLFPILHMCSGPVGPQFQLRALRVRNSTKSPQSIPYRRIGAVGSQRIKAALARIMTTTTLISGKRDTPQTRMGGV